MSLNIEFQTLDAGSVFHVKASDFVPGWDAFIRPAPAVWAGKDGHFYEFQSLDVYLDALSIARSMAEDDRPIAPAAVTMRQARLAFLGAGMLAGVDDAINVMPEPLRTAAKIEWEYATEVRRDASLVSGIKAAIGLTDEQIDQLFIAASEL